jgi:hypothetical protein
MALLPSDSESLSCMSQKNVPDVKRFTPPKSSRRFARNLTSGHGLSSLTSVHGMHTQCVSNSLRVCVRNVSTLNSILLSSPVLVNAGPVPDITRLPKTSLQVKHRVVSPTHLSDFVHVHTPTSTHFIFPVRKQTRRS